MRIWNRRTPSSRTMLRFLIVLFLMVAKPCSGGHPYPIKIGAIFHDGDELHKRVFEYAVTKLKDERVAPVFELQPIVKWINVSTDSFNTAAAACQLLEEGVAAIFGPGSTHTRGVVSSIAAHFDVPHIEFAWRRIEDAFPPANNVNVHPNSKSVSEAIAEVLKAVEWRQFTAIYKTQDGLSRIQDALLLHGPQDFPVSILHLGDGPDYRHLLKDVASSNKFNIIVDVENPYITDVLRQAREVKLFEDYYNYIITDLDITTTGILDVINESRANITGFRLLTDEIDVISTELNSNIQAEQAILYDSVNMLYDVLEVLYIRNQNSEEPVKIEPTALSCGGTDKYEAGPTILSMIHELTKIGKTTGVMTFDETGQRDFELQIVEIQQKHFVQTAIWDKDGLRFTRSSEERETDTAKSMEDKLFRVTTREGAPFMMEVTDGPTRGIMIDNKWWEGYSIDLIDEIAKMLNFKYKFELVPDGKYGSYNKKTKTWDGLVKRLLDHAADLALCDLTITSERKQAVDFTMPFMNLGISILYRKPEVKPPSLFSFLSPLSTDVWIYMATAYLGVSLMLFIQARMAPSEWDNPHPCNPEPTELENNFNLKNSLWLTIGSLMQQGSDVLPKAPSIRMVAGMWWFFVLIMVSSYTANLAAFLTMTKMEVTIESAEDLAKQTKIKYGAVKGGSTSSFFRDSNFSTYQRMWTAMADAKPSVFTATNDEGVDRVIKGKGDYAFLMESTSIEYREEQNCELTRVGHPLDSKGYGIAMPLNSNYRTMISEAVLKLQEQGVLNKLKKKWWKDHLIATKRSGNCTNQENAEEENSNELGMDNVGGIFLVLWCGCGFAFLIAIFEFLWNVRKVAVEEKITPGEALAAEFKFIVNIRAVTKPVKMAKSSSTTSSAVGGFERAASTGRSMVGSFLRLNILDKFDKENGNNKSNGHKIN
ncbi:glutamate receptor ionotropic, kainate 2 [Orussus abietinus]|uniref:glutamate receptor ionotropic, kainate 2 n=1 Tax=Orussus abietinus TaxID=222816 RepID=UPI0006266324|nr:glutamate receptor ionotropic, kainate 2 [Orussus abietinus]